MLWNMLKDKEEWDERMSEERDVNREYATEMSEWLTLTNNMSEEINRLRDSHEQEMGKVRGENERLRRELEAMKDKVSLLG
jgi:DNA repair ATPase RecN